VANILVWHVANILIQEVYDLEGIKWTKEDFVNNEAVLSLYGEVSIANTTPN